MICPRCEANPVDVVDVDGRGLCLSCYAEILEERGEVARVG